MKGRFSFLPLKSLSSRLSLWTVLFAALLFSAALIFLFRLSDRTVRREASNRAEQVLDNTVLRVNGILEDVELAAANLEWLVLRNLDKPDTMVTLSNQVVINNPVLNSCSISFEPYYFREKGLYYSVFSYRSTGDSVNWEQEGDDTYQYFYMNWYLLPKLLKRACWTEPYEDMDFGDDREMDTQMLVSYCRPLYDADSTFVGAISLDISLKWLSETVSAVRPYPNSYSVLVGHGGTYLVHPDPEKLFYQTLFTEGLAAPDPERYELGQSMRRRESGMREMKLDGVQNFVFFKPLENNGWSVAIVCPESDIFGGLKRIQRSVWLNVLLGLVAMFVVIVLLVRRQLSPLRELADEAGYIASGNLDHPLPPAGRNDEIGLLNRSFRNMQSSLVRHIRELTEATAAQERLARELQIARNIQMGMVPHTFPERADVDLFASMMPAKEVGGDLYDFFIQGEKLYFCVGDVSGKGIPASLFMAVSRGMFRVVAGQELPPAEIARRINDAVSEENEMMLFVTMFIGVIDLSTGMMEYCNCGHNAPVLMPCDGGQARFLECIPNTAIGIVSGFSYEGQRIDDVRGKAIFVYTDGLNEAEDAAHSQFGNERMISELGCEPFTDARGLITRMEQAVTVHVAGADPSDDLTMLCVKFG